jgi:hypothetical protein
MAVWLGNLLWRASSFIAAAWLGLNYSNGWTLYSVNHAAAQAGIIVLIGVAFRLLVAGKQI